MGVGPAGARGGGVGRTAMSREGAASHADLSASESPSKNLSGKTKGAPTHAAGRVTQLSCLWRARLPPSDRLSTFLERIRRWRVRR